MQNLLAEMARYNVSNADIQRILNCSAKTVTNKLTGVTEFTIPEGFKIRNAFFPGLRLDYLFATSESAAPGGFATPEARDSA